VSPLPLARYQRQPPLPPGSFPFSPSPVYLAGGVLGQAWWLFLPLGRGPFPAGKATLGSSRLPPFPGELSPELFFFFFRESDHPPLRHQGLGSDFFLLSAPQAGIRSLPSARDLQVRISLGLFPFSYSSPSPPRPPVFLFCESGKACPES